LFKAFGSTTVVEVTGVEATGVEAASCLFYREAGSSEVINEAAP